MLANKWRLKHGSKSTISGRGRKMSEPPRVRHLQLGYLCIAIDYDASQNNRYQFVTT